ncbi:MAG: radical SAM protein [Planctomycetes bacterium]|nr:radical SAM protein [Planctomycetota bacterium]
MPSNHHEIEHLAAALRTRLSGVREKLHRFGSEKSEAETRERELLTTDFYVQPKSKVENRKSKIRMPGFCVILPTESCMLKCRMCYNWKLVDDPNEVTLSEWIRFVDDLAELVDEPIEINIGGGEPLQRLWVIDLAKHAIEKGFTISIVTNGVPLTEDVVKRIGDAGIQKIALSLDGLTAETHDKIRGVNGSHRIIMNAIKKLSMWSPQSEITIQTILMRPNLHEIPGLIDFVNERDDVKALFTMALMQPHHEPHDELWFEREKNRDIWPQPEDMPLVDRAIEALISNAGDGKVGNPVSQLDAFRGFFHKPYQFIKNDGCTIGDYGLHVNSKGEVFICMNLHSAGNIKSGSIKDIWFADSAMDLRGIIPVCDKNCEFLVNCYYEEESSRAFVNGQVEN